jgi:hypothetical protein
MEEFWIYYAMFLATLYMISDVYRSLRMGNAIERILEEFDRLTYPRRPANTKESM